MSAGDYLAGLLFFLGTCAGAGIVAERVARRRLSHLAGAALALAAALVFVAALLLAHLVPGALGVLWRESVLACSLLLAALSTRIPPSGAQRTPAPAASHGGGFSVGLAAAALAVVSAYLVAAAVQVRHAAPTHIDALSFGLPGVARWIGEETLWGAGAYLPLFQVRTYPNNGDLVSLATMLPWRNDAFLRLTALPLIAMTALAVYATARELRVPAATAALVAAAVPATRVVTVPAIDQIKPDVFMYATYAAGVLFLVRHARTRARSDLVLAGLGLGLAFGSRWYGLSTAAVAIAVWAAGLLLARSRLRDVAAEAALLSGVTLAAGGFWLVRNAVLTGNPLYPLKLDPLGVTLLDAPRDIITERLGYTIADRIGQPEVWSDHVLADWWDALGAPGVLALVGAVAALGLGLAALRRGSVEGARPVALVVAALGAAAAYAVTPGSAQGFEDAPLPGLVGGNSRWLVPALLLALPAAAWAVSRLKRGRAAAEVVLLGVVLAGIPPTFDVGAGLLLKVVAVMALGAALAFVLWRAARRGAARRVRAAVALGAAVLVLGGYELQQTYNELRFREASPIVDLIERELPAGSRIGFAGDWPEGFVPLYAAFGPRLENEVRYVGPVRHGQLRQYRRASEFRAALRRGGYDLLVVGRAPEPRFRTSRAPRAPLLDDPPEARWARAAGFREAAGDAAFRAFVSPRLAATVAPP